MRIRNPNMPRSPREDGVNRPSRGPRGPMAPPMGRAAAMGKPVPQQMQGLAAGAGMGLGAMGARGATSGMGMAGYKNGGSVMSGRAQVKGKKFTGTF